MARAMQVKMQGILHSIKAVIWFEGTKLEPVECFHLETDVAW